MNTYPLSTIRDAFDWFGFEPRVDGDTLTISEGRVGLEANPLTISDDSVSGGYYFPETVVSLQKKARYVDIVLDETTDRVMVLIRSDTEAERISYQYRILMRLMQRDTAESSWLVARKEYVHD